MSPPSNVARDLAEAYLDQLPSDQWTKGMRERIPAERLFELWTIFLGKRHGLTPVDVWGRYGHPRTGLSKARRAELWRDREWRDWLEKILSIRVELHPGGRAVLEEPDPIFSVEVQWMVEHGTPTPTFVGISSDSSLPWNVPFDIDAYFAACRLKLEQHARAKARLPRRRPRSGESRDLSFYVALLDEYDRLLKEGSTAPARELADRMGVKHSTMKSYLKRGRVYRQRGEG